MVDNNVAGRLALITGASSGFVFPAPMFYDDNESTLGLKESAQSAEPDGYVALTW